MPLFTSEAVVIKRIKLGEADRIITFLTRDYGKIQAVAKGARRAKSKFGASLEPLTLSNLIFFGKDNANLYQINSADIINPFSANGSDYEKIRKSLFLLEAVNVLTREKDHNPAIFDLLLSSLEAIGKTSIPEKLEARVTIFLLMLISTAGYSPKLKNCVFCDKSGKISAFNIQKGGVVCSECIPGSSDSFKISQGAVNFMKAVLTNENIMIIDRVVASEHQHREITQLLKGFMRTHIGVTIKSLNNHQYS